MDKIKKMLGDNWKAALIGAVAVFVGLAIGAPGVTMDAADALTDDDVRAEICEGFEPAAE